MISSSSAEHSRHQRAQQRATIQLAARLAAFFEQSGYELLETPFIQEAELFLTKAGDQLINRLFTFERGGRELALRPEFTVSAASLYNVQHPTGDAIARWQFHGAVFEDDPDQPQFSQRYTFDAELIGLHGANADAEIIALCARGLNEVGVASWRVQLGHVGLIRALLKPFALDTMIERLLLAQLPSLREGEAGKANVLAMLDHSLLGSSSDHGSDSDDQTRSQDNAHYVFDALLDATQRGTAMGGRSRHDIVARLIRKRQRTAQRPMIGAALDLLGDLVRIDDAPHSAIERIRTLIPASSETAHGLLHEWEKMIDLLTGQHGIPESHLRVQPAFIRNWDYYTGMIFDLRTADDRLLGGGGRYDGLTRLVGGDVAVPAVGFAYYADLLPELVNTL